MNNLIDAGDAAVQTVLESEAFLASGLPQEAASEIAALLIKEQFPQCYSKLGIIYVNTVKESRNEEEV